MSKTPQPLYQALAGLVQARINCIKSGNTEWQAKHEQGIKELCNFLPSGSGLDSNPKINLAESHGEKLVFDDCDYHHMDENGFYCGWTQHRVTVKGSLASGVQIAISGRDRNEIKDYIHEVFDQALNDRVKQHETEPGVWEWVCERYAEAAWS